MSLGKYLTNMSVIGAIFGALGTFRQTQEMPRDWRRYLPWVVWGVTLVLALAGVAKQAEDERYEVELKQARRDEKAATKAARRRS